LELPLISLIVIESGESCQANHALSGKPLAGICPEIEVRFPEAPFPKADFASLSIEGNDMILRPGLIKRFHNLPDIVIYADFDR
jgi:hypothetical protein